jgi:hypothetical protein
VTGNSCNYTDRLTAYVGRLGIALEYSPDIAPAKGLSHGGKITLVPYLSPAETFSVLVHEVSHELLHRNERRAKTNRTIRETEPEAVGFVVCQAIGSETNGSSADYIQSWRGDKQTLTESLGFFDRQYLIDPPLDMPARIFPSHGDVQRRSACQTPLPRIELQQTGHAVWQDVYRLEFFKRQLFFVFMDQQRTKIFVHANKYLPIRRSPGEFPTFG